MLGSCTTRSAVFDTAEIFRPVAEIYAVVVVGDFSFSLFPFRTKRIGFTRDKHDDDSANIKRTLTLYCPGDSSDGLGCRIGGVATDLKRVTNVSCTIRIHGGDDDGRFLRNLYFVESFLFFNRSS